VVKLAVGDVVVYGAHGAGTVETRETRSVDGEQQTVVVVALAGGLSVQLPLALAQERLRALVDEPGLMTVEQVLRATPPRSGESWLQRRREALTKLGDAIGLAEIIRDGHIRETAPARGFGSRLAPSERELVQRARGLLTNEIALARNVSVAVAEAWLNRQLAVGP
jgi:CarD family transcriptional regulator, regulator of rRNA transcription